MMIDKTKVSDESVMHNELQPDHEYAVDMQQVCKTYGGKKDGFAVLKQMNLRVPYGTIYGLLGPSGCGKTTLLRCIMGRVQIDSGKVTVFGETPGHQVVSKSKPRIGFMPQDIALGNTLLVEEAISFFGRIANMEKSKIEARGKFLLNFLDIQNTSKKLIGNLSGGQKRRVSMAIALLHEPELLLLDEPTVGVDPVLRASIWEYLTVLVNMKEKPVTIIITTHYIEEAALANNVGLLLNGRLLAQSPPDRLMQMHCCSTLEEVFLKLCLDNKNNNPDLIDDDDRRLNVQVEGAEQKLETSNKTVLAKKRGVCSRSPNKCINTLSLPRWNQVVAFFWKDMRFFLRHIGLFILELLLPPAIIVVFAISVGKALYGLPIGIVNDDVDYLGQNFVDSINKNTLTQSIYANYDEAEEAAKDGEIMGFIYMKQNFTSSILQRFHHGLITTDTAFNESLISINLDWSNQQAAYTITNALLLGFLEFMQNTFGLSGLNPMAAGIPITYADRQVYGSSGGNFDQFLFPGFVLCETFFLAMGLTAISLSTERLSGNLERMLITGAQTIEVILGHMFAHLVLMTAQIAAIFIVAFTIFNFSCDGSYFLAAALAAVHGVCGMYLGFLLAMACTSETAVIMCGLALMFFGLLSGGLLWPLECLPYGLKVLSQLIPQTWAIDAMRSIMNRGWGLLYIQVFAGFGASIIWTAIFCTAGLLFAKIRL